MANINLSFTTNAKQDAKLAKVLAAVNAERAQQELPQFATVQDYLSFIVIEVVKSYVKRQHEIDAAAVAQAFDAASDEQKAAAQAALGM